ncbi:MAG TPA: TIGR01841 family phasin [Burkholderiaceae bacterium]|nr:TIGR01841 family phasin [Burkholderiaceae bacterium]
MYTTPDQLVAAHKAALESFQAVAAKSFEGLEKLAELNLAATKSTLEETAEQFKALLEVKDVKALADFAAGSAQPAADKVTAYSKHVYEITSDTGSEIAKLIEKQFAEGNRQLHAAIDALAKNAPAGSEGVVTFMKSAVSAANTAYDQVNKATKQVVELAEANIVAAGKTAANGAARAKKAA